MNSRSFAAGLALATGIVAATPAQAQERLFDIPAGNLAAALDAYGRQAGRTTSGGSAPMASAAMHRRRRP